MSDGSVSLHRVDRGSAVVVWPSLGAGGQAVRSVAWVPYQPACFLVLDAACTLHFFDLAKVRMCECCTSGTWPRCAAQAVPTNKAAEGSGMRACACLHSALHACAHQCACGLGSAGASL